MKARFLAVVLAIGMSLALVPTAAAAQCPPNVIFGCNLAGATGGYGWLVQNNGFAGIYAASTSAAAGAKYGLVATAASPDGIGVYGSHNATTGTAAGVYGLTSSTSSSANAILGTVRSTAPGGFSSAVRGANNGTAGLGIGVYGSQNGSGWGVYGYTPSGRGVYGYSPSGIGVYGLSSSSYGVYGAHSASTGTAAGVYGSTSSTDSSANAVYGVVSSTAPGGASAAVRGQNNGTSGLGIGVYGSQNGSGWGVYGYAPSGIGVYGSTSSGTGVRGISSTGYGVYGSHSSSTGTVPGIYGTTNSTDGSAYAIHGVVTNSAPGGFSTGVRGQNNGTGGLGIGVWGSQAGNGWGVYGSVPAGSTGYAGYFSGNVRVNGSLSVSGAKNFVIDHPLDPANKLLYHAAVESSEMKNVYDGVATLDASGSATVQLPNWFEAANKDFRYQLTAMGAAAPQLHVSSEIKGNRFSIAGGKPGTRISWQVTGVRRDAYAQAHPMQVEVEKRADERGKYFDPAAFGQPAQAAIDYETRQATSQAASDALPASEQDAQTQRPAVEQPAVNNSVGQ